ncbi:MAG: hypothetical protein WCH99_03115 [Verrucomicrobiota bacterium]
MKKLILLLVTSFIGLGLMPASAQFGPPGGAPQGPRFGGAMDKLFGANQTFSATLEFHTTESRGETVTMPGKISFDNGKSRFEMNMSETKGTKMPPDAAEQLKSMGMDTMISISHPDKKTICLVYPGLHSYAEIPAPDTATKSDPADSKIETTEIGKETEDGHNCVKNKVAVIDKDGTKHESTVWNASDLNNFPVKIITTEKGQNSTMLFRNISFTKPAANSFDAPKDFNKYNDIQTMMQTEILKKMGGGMGMPSSR